MLDANDLVRTIKQASTDAADAGYPADIMTGTVTAAIPLTIKVEQRFDIGREQLIIPEYLTEHKINITIKGSTEKSGVPEHDHAFGEKKTVTVHNGLKAGDRVVLIRQQGGQKFLIIDRVV